MSREVLTTDKFVIIKEDGIVFEKLKSSVTVNLYHESDYSNPGNENNRPFTAHTLSGPNTNLLISFVNKWLREDKIDF